MAANYVFTHITAEQLHHIQHPHPKRNLRPIDTLCKSLGIPDKHDPKSRISLDLYSSSLQLGQELRMANDKMSALLGLVKEVHTTSVGQRLQVERSFLLFKQLLLCHSVQRPPYSIGLFNLSEMQAITTWMLETYYRHYKLYQYVFTNRVTLSVSSHHPTDVVELPPPLVALEDFITDEAQQQIWDAERKQSEDEEQQAAEQRAALEEKARTERLRAEYEQAIPDEIKDQVKAAVDKEVELLKTNMEHQFQTQQAALLTRIAELEAQRTAAK